MKCTCGNEVSTPFCPQCGHRSSVLSDLLDHCARNANDRAANIQILESEKHTKPATLRTAKRNRGPRQVATLALRKLIEKMDG